MTRRFVPVGAYLLLVVGVAVALQVLQPISLATLQPTSVPIPESNSNYAVQDLQGTLRSTVAGRSLIALTPPMGWNGFNHFVHNVSAATVESEARALVDSGMKNAGYTYVNLDGGWNLRQRSASGRLQPDPRKFPEGIKPVADYVHSLGLKFGIYASAGMTNCAGSSAGSYGHYLLDAATFASWGVDYVKFDWCYIPYGNYPHRTRRLVSQMLAGQMRVALSMTGRAMVYDVNDWTDDQPWMWAGSMSHMWRTAPDSQDTYASMVLNFVRNVQLFERAAPGRWNDPDMLEVGNGGMSASEYRSQFSLWAEMSAPLIAGNDLARMSAVTRSMLTNQSVIAVDQDPLGRQAVPVLSANAHWVLAKPLANGDAAVVLFNQSDSPAMISATPAEVGLDGRRRYDLLDLWTGQNLRAVGVIAAMVPAHGVVMYEVSRSPFRPLTS